MSPISWRSVQDDIDSCRQVAGDPIRFGCCDVVLKSGLDPDGPETGIVGALDVNLLVADEKGSREIDLMIPRSFYDHSDRGFAAIRMLPGNVRAEISGVD